MADKLKDAEDQLLEALFEAAPIADDGFSERVVRRIRRQLWVRRLALPVAMVVGGAIALEPATDLMIVFSKLLTAAPPSMLPQAQDVAFGASLLPLVVLGAMLVTAGILGTRLLQE